MGRTSKAEGDAAFTDFMVQAEPSLMRTAWLLTGSTEAARELVQVALVKTYVSWAKVRPETALAFARRVLVNHKVDVWRSRSREVLTDTLDRPVAAGGTTGSGASDDRDEIVRLLARLPEQQRKTVVLRFYADLSERDTADALGVSVGTVKAATSRGLATLRELSGLPAPDPATRRPERSPR
ncbi:SigE family RNA polymerase sigma factor [Lapillicoccus sp.]|uniref:SigE family RNA polymerase sigma factor n=1 Tax=Lapillicoccus sp. TaxID=1909287 RepID=UPI0025EC2890|nr:SigE family RNA polymerase sigma factor [Lapillicoccus sp.]